MIQIPLPPFDPIGFRITVTGNIALAQGFSSNVDGNRISGFARSTFSASGVIMVRPLRPSPAPTKDRTANGTFASISPVANSRTVGFGYLFTPSHGLTRLVNGRKR